MDDLAGALGARDDGALDDEERTTFIVDTLAEAFSDLMTASPAAFRNKFRKMAAEPFAFYRGSACLYYADVARLEDRWVDERTWPAPSLPVPVRLGPGTLGAGPVGAGVAAAVGAGRFLPALRRGLRRGDATGRHGAWAGRRRGRAVRALPARTVASSGHARPPSPSDHSASGVVIGRAEDAVRTRRSLHSARTTVSWINGPR